MQIIPLRNDASPSLKLTSMRLARPCDVSVIIPALNEALNLPALFGRIDAAMAGRSYEIVLVDDGSRDETVATCQVLADGVPLRLIVRKNPAGGLSGAVLHGMALARGNTFVVMDADLQHPPEAIGALLAPLDNGDADFSIGSRYVDGGRTHAGWSWLRKVNSLGATLLARPVAGRVRDPMSGFFALHAETYRRAARLTPLGYKIALELMCKCRVQCVCEVPIEFGDRAEGESKLSIKQQLRFIRHLGRLYAFAFPKLSAAARLLAGGVLGYAFAAVTNPAMAILLAPWTAAGTFVMTAAQAARTTSRRALAADEVDLNPAPAAVEPAIARAA